MTTYTKSIEYSREDKDFACSLNGEIKAYARSYAEGDALLDALIAELLKAERPSAFAAAIEDGAAFSVPGCSWCAGGDGPLCAACQAAEIRELERVAV